MPLIKLYHRFLVAYYSYRIDRYARLPFQRQTTAGWHRNQSDFDQWHKHWRLARIERRRTGRRVMALVAVFAGIVLVMW